MQIEVHNCIVDKAKERKDGVYSFRRYFYAVKNNNFVAYVDAVGFAFAVHGVFHTTIGRVEIYDKKKKLLEYLRNLK